MRSRVSELVVPVARLVVGNGNTRALDVQPVGSERPVFLALENEALLAVDVGGRVENLVAVVRVGTDELRGGRFGCRCGGPRERLLPCGIERVDFAAELAVFLFEPVEAFNETLEGIGMRRACRPPQRRRNDDARYESPLSAH